MRTGIIILFVALLSISNARGQSKKERLLIAWPKEYDWIVATDQENKSSHMRELIPGKEHIDSWTIIATTITYKGVQVPVIDNMARLMLTETKKSSSEAKLTIIEKSRDTVNSWIIFKIESPSFNNDPKPESQLYYVIQGKSSLHSNFVAIKQKELPEEFVNKWTTVFKESKIVN
ncbi:MAG: hypothetical protein ABIN95_06980 [Mucilaginibacter sp.]